MKLSQVPRDSKVILMSDIGRARYTFIKIDGMYAHLRTYDWKLVHVPAWTQVEVDA